MNDYREALKNFTNVMITSTEGNTPEQEEKDERQARLELFYNSFDAIKDKTQLETDLKTLREEAGVPLNANFDMVYTAWYEGLNAGLDFFMEVCQILNGKQTEQP